MEKKQTEKLLKTPLTEAGISYSVAAVLPVLLSFIVMMILSAAIGEGYAESNLYKYLGYLAPQLSFAAAALLFFRRTKTPACEVYAPCKWYYVAFGVALAFGLFSLSELNGLFIGLLEKIGYRQPASMLPDLGGWYLLPALLIIAALPAIFEETLFRGIQVSVMRKSGWGTAAVVFISGALFSLFHGNPAQTVYQFLCGAAYALLAVRSGSVIPTMTAHFLNNGVILVLGSFGMEDFPAAVKPYLYSVAGVVLLATLVYLIFFDKSNRQQGKISGGKQFFLAAAVGIAVCLVEWITVLIAGCGA